MDASMHEFVAEQLALILDLDVAEVSGDSSFSDIGADSVDLIEVVNRAELKFGLHVEEEQLADLVTVRDLASLLENELDA